MSCCSSGAGIVSAGANSMGELAEQRLLAAAHSVGEGLSQNDFVVPGMHCIACIRTIETALGELPFVERVRVNLSLKRVTVVWREDDPVGSNDVGEA